MKKTSTFLILLISCLTAFAQTATIETDSTSISITNIATTQENPQLLPNHYLFTQRILWSEHGLMRKLPSIEFNEQNRQREVEWRTYMLKAHRVLGYATILGMIGQAYTGAKLFSLDEHSSEVDKWKNIHSGIAAYTSTTYFASAGMILFAPPWKGDRAPGYSNVKLHKYLAMVHLTSMIASLATAGGAQHSGFVRDFHRATAYTAFGAYFISTVVIHL